MSTYRKGEADDRQIEHQCRFGTVFSAKANLRGGVVVVARATATEVQIASDAAQFGAWHAMQIHPTLRGFSGYDAVRYEFMRSNHS